MRLACAWFTCVLSVAGGPLLEIRTLRLFAWRRQLWRYFAFGSVLPAMGSKWLLGYLMILIRR